jgi:hypothetical protein
MARRIATTVVLALALDAAAGAGPGSRAAAQHALVTLPLDDPAYAQLDGLVQLGCGAARVSAFRPFMIKDVRDALRRATQERRCAGRVLDALVTRFQEPPAAPAGAVADDPRVTFGAAASIQATALHGGEMEPLWRDVRPTAEGTPSLVGVADLRLTWRGGPKLVAVADAYGETSRRNDPTVRAGIFRNTSAVIDFGEAYLSGQFGPLVLSVGREREAWIGQRDESLVLSANGPALDRIGLTAQWSRFEFKALLASVNDVVLTPRQDSLPDSLGTERWHRMLIGHALTFRPSHRLELTIGETGMIPRRGGGVDLQYVNPLLIYQVAQEDSARPAEPGGNVNLTAFGSVRANAGPVAVQGDLVIDDIQIDSRDRRVFPSQIGWNVRGSYALPLSMPTSLVLQYRRIGSFTYLENFYTDTWQQYNQPVGSALGPDADLGRVGGDLWPLGRLHLSAGISRWRHGANRIDERPLPPRRGHAGDPFPSTTAERPEVQRAWIGDASVEWLDAILPLTLRVEGARISNINNQPAPPRRVARVQLSGSYRFRYP